MTSAPPYQFRYDKLDRLSRIARNKVNGATVLRTLYDHNCFDKADDLVATIPPSAGKADVTCGALTASDKATRMTYDKALRPLSEQLPGKAPRTATYDDNGNVATSTDEE